MGRGPKKHLKRVNAPKHWMLSKLDGVHAPKPSAGPHKGRESVPLIILLRNRLKYALTGAEANAICMQELVKVDKRVRTDMYFPAGFMDVVSVEKSGDYFRMLYDTKGRFTLNRLSSSDAETSYKLCRIVKHSTLKSKIPFVVTHDGRTIRYPDPLVKLNDTVKIDLESGKIIDFYKFAAGNLVMLTGGRNTGRVGVISSIEKHPGSFDIVSIRDSEGNVFATRKQNVFILGNGTTPAVKLPKGKGLRKGILEEATLRERAAKNAKKVKK